MFKMYNFFIYVVDYQKFLNMHCRERQYMFQVKKCDVETCCRPRVSQTDFPWLPDPLVKEDDKDHFKPFDDVVFTDTIDSHPAGQVAKAKDVAEQQQVGLGLCLQILVCQILWILYIFCSVFFMLPDKDCLGIELYKY